tara:strand:+ start:698 stop:1210 length:513 start_codon:yes stop_codon:yes gene_type:complete
MKTIEEVREHFKNAKRIKCVDDGQLFNFCDLEIKQTPYSRAGFFGYLNGKVACTLIDLVTNEFAKIIEYKYEKLYTLKEECKKYYPTQARDSKCTHKTWNIPLSMLDEVKEIEVKAEWVKSTQVITEGVTVFNINIEVSDITLITSSQYKLLNPLLIDLEEATKEFFKNK